MNFDDNGNNFILPGAANPADPTMMPIAGDVSVYGQAEQLYMQEAGDANKINSAHDDLKRNSAVADALFGTAIVTGVTGLVLVLLKEKKEQPQEPKNFEVGLGVHSIVAKGRF